MGELNGEWIDTQDMVREKFPWIQFMYYCVTHEESLIIKGICNIDEVPKNMIIHFNYIIHVQYMSYMDLDRRIGTLDHRCAEVVHDV